jgi:hypothetical protein
VIQLALDPTDGSNRMIKLSEAQKEELVDSLVERVFQVHKD